MASGAKDAKGRKGKVLVVEDDPAIISLLETLLESEGYAVEVAEDGLEGLVKQQFTRPDIAIVDVMMPDVDGVRMLEELIAEGGGALPLPVVVVTGSPEGARRCRELIGDENVFQKPFDTAELMARVAAVRE